MSISKRLMCLSVAVVLLGGQNVKGQNFSFQRVTVPEDGAYTSALVVLFDHPLNPEFSEYDEMENDLIASSSADVSAEEEDVLPERINHANGLAASEATLNIATGNSGFVPTMSVAGSLQAAADVWEDAGPPSAQGDAIAVADSTSYAQGYFTTTNANSGSFVAGLYITGVGVDVGVAGVDGTISSSLLVGSKSYSIVATYDIPDREFDVTVSRNGQPTFTYSTPGLNEFVHIRDTLPAGPQTVYTSSAGSLNVQAVAGNLSMNSTPFSQTLWQYSSGAFVWGAEFPGDTDDDDDVDDDDMDNLGDGIGIVGGADPIDGDVNGDGSVTSAGELQSHELSSWIPIAGFQAM